jgi:GAF domain-containing protein/CHASE3 domain sensor protein
MKLNISLGQRIAFGFFLTVIFVFVAVAAGLWSTISLRGVIGALNKNINQVESIAEIEESLQDIAATIDDMLLFEQSTTLMDQRLDRQTELLHTQLIALNSMILGQHVDITAENQKITAELQQKGQELITSVETLKSMGKRDLWDRSRIYRHSKMAEQEHQIDEILGRLRVNIREEVEFSVAASRESQSATQIVWGFVAIFAVAVGVLSAILVGRSITRPIYQLIGQVERVTHRNFSPISPLLQKDEIGELSRSVALMTDWLRESYSTLEDQVTARTERLELVARLSESLSSILNLEDLLHEVVNQVRNSFNYYYAHIYLLNETENRLVVFAGTGSAGAKMQTDGYSIPVNTPTSLVARAARTGQTVHTSDVRQTIDWLPNPLLPDTASEIAVPIMQASTGKVVGVLDVQQNRIAGFDESDISLLRSLANHVAVAINNARLFEQVETALNAAHEAQAHYTQQTWDRAKLTPQTAGYHYTRANALSLDPFKIQKTREQASTQADPQLIVLNEENISKTSNTDLSDEEQTIQQTMMAPVALHNKQIGTVQVHSVRSDPKWTEDDLAILAAVVDELAQTAENLRLFDETQQRASQEQSIREITDKLRSAPNLSRLTEIATEELGRRLLATYAELNLGTTTSQNGRDS